jgi:hypothetical protein
MVLEDPFSGSFSMSRTIGPGLAMWVATIASNELRGAGCRAWCSKSPKPISERQADFVYVKGTPGVSQIARRREQSAFGASR